MQRQQTRETPPGVKIGNRLPRIAVVTRNTRRRLSIDTAAMAAFPTTIDILQAKISMHVFNHHFDQLDIAMVCGEVQRGP